MDKLVECLLWYFVFLFSTVFHEAAHAATAFWLGDKTAYEGGQVSLNPIPHMKREPFGTLLVPFFTFFAAGWMMGWASTPYDFHWALRYPTRSGLMSLAGPVANLILVLTAALFIHLGIYAGVFHSPDVIHYSSVVVAGNTGITASVASFLSIFFSLNLILFTFNLLPLPPLDGSGVVTLFMADRMAEKYLLFVHHSGLQFISFIVAWQLFDVIFDPFWTVALNLLYPGAGYH